MRFRGTLITILAFTIPYVGYAKSGLNVSFHTGFPITGTSIGLKIGPLAPYGGVDIIRVSASFTESRTTWERSYYTGNLYKYYDKSSEFEGSAMLIIPHAGIRLYLKQKNLMAYLKGDILLAIPSVDGRDKGKRVYYNPDGTISSIDEWDDELTEEDKDNINDVLDFWGLSPGFGIEYPISKHFTVGGEYGLRIFFNSVTNEGSDVDEYDGEIDWKEEWKDEMNAYLGITYTSFTLNYYF